MQEPNITWSTFSPAISRTFTTRSGWKGWATMGSREDRSMSMTSS